MPNVPSPLTARFLQYCLRARLEPDALDAARELIHQAGLDWDQVLTAARDQLVTPILHAVLRDEPSTPSPVSQALRSGYAYTRRRNRVLFGELATVLPALAAAGAPAAVLNGAALIDSAYGDIGLRQLRDIDLLIRPESHAVAVEALGPLGYAPVNAELHGGEVVVYESQLILRKSDIVEVALEVHDRPLDLAGEAAARFAEWTWTTASPAPPSHGGDLTLSPEARFIYLGAHAALRHAGRLLWLHDMAEFLHRASGRIEWSVVVDRVGAFGLAAPVQASVARLIEGWGAPIPQPVQERLQALASLPPDGRGPGRMPAGGSASYGWAGHPVSRRWDERLRQIVAQALPPPQYMVRKYRIAHRQLVPLYYPVRWLAGLRQWLGL